VGVPHGDMYGMRGREIRRGWIGNMYVVHDW
jgi:hypothetical protein